MAGIVAALEAHDDVGPLRQPVDDLALAFVAPLGADDDHIRHRLPFRLGDRGSPARSTAGSSGSPRERRTIAASLGRCDPSEALTADITRPSKLRGRRAS